MTEDEQREIAEVMEQARRQNRGYADFFGWASKRDYEELNVVRALDQALASNDQQMFHDIVSRGRGNDPPDCEALTFKNRRAAIEVTELVDGKAIQAYKKGEKDSLANWSCTHFASVLTGLIQRKDTRYEYLKGAPYPGGYYVVVFSDEPCLTRGKVDDYLNRIALPRPRHINRVYLLLSYDPDIDNYPYFELTFAE